MDYNAIIAFLNGFAPWVHYVWLVLGTLTVVGTFLDTVMPKLGFSAHILSIPVVGEFLKHLTKFSPFNFKTPEEK